MISTSISCFAPDLLQLWHNTTQLTPVFRSVYFVTCELYFEGLANLGLLCFVAVENKAVGACARICGDDLRGASDL